ncbi:protein YIPF5/7 [Nematocida homosporus]|uniref:protein YIPF5/7 n=1 Tax=Nematocida homosporus TaxID=1912981 RepID=UPI00221F53EF|nr:protein YIPF5/7 [Nematocida homosporus]KAI5184306.1 protein YIPF5/7 [Nematocida homosporus]
MQELDQNYDVSIANALSGYLPGDMPLLDDLGVDFYTIQRDTLRVFFVKREAERRTNDVTGPALFLVVFALILAIRGRVHFTYMYSLFAVCSFFICGLISTMQKKPITLLSIINILGYAFVPILLFALLSVIIPCGKGLKLFFGIGFALWSTTVSTLEVINRYAISNQVLLLGYPIFLVYICFMIIAVV